MKTIQLEFFDINNRKHIITINENQTELLFSEGIKIDASDILGIFYVCESDFILKPFSNKEKSLIACNVYDETGKTLEKLKEDKKEELNTKAEQIRQFFSDFSFNTIHTVKPQAI